MVEERKPALLKFIASWGVEDAGAEERWKWRWRQTSRCRSWDSLEEGEAVAAVWPAEETEEEEEGGAAGAAGEFLCWRTEGEQRRCRGGSECRRCGRRRRRVQLSPAASCIGAAPCSGQPSLASPAASNSTPSLLCFVPSLFSSFWFSTARQNLFTEKSVGLAISGATSVTAHLDISCWALSSIEFRQSWFSLFHHLLLLVFRTDDPSTPPFAGKAYFLASETISISPSSSCYSSSSSSSPSSLILSFSAAWEISLSLARAPFSFSATETIREVENAREPALSGMWCRP